MTEFDQGPRALLKAGRGATEPTEEDRVRIRRALAARVGAPALVASAGGAGAAAVAASKAQAAGAAAIHAESAFTQGVASSIAGKLGIAQGALGKLIVMAGMGAAAGGATAIVVHDRVTFPPHVSAWAQPSTMAPVRTSTPPMRPTALQPSTALSSIDSDFDRPDLKDNELRPMVVRATDDRRLADDPPASETIRSSPQHRVTMHRAAGDLPPVPRAQAVRAASTLAPVRADWSLAPIPVPVERSLADEVALISEMQSAWAEARLTDVKNTIADHEVGFPHGALVEEREAMKALLACRGADPEPARTIADEFASRYPGSAHTARVILACCGQTRR